ncbi:MAG: 8-oxo-dGTP diphosphatase [Chloroflexi bacterium]|nr:MAG: 8-oxo-dGTP diphosphatase [Chloroflexota bacterium]MBL1193530.1 8-oxo-dGTP diphosphatase [Chloroflexota bacterium]NOH10821.1 8-oxo-dGTP diphosphatase [Chloroflexota bacterium]
MPSSDQGVFKDRYAVIPRALIFLTRGDKVLLLKGAPTKRVWPNKYNGVGGHIERDEDILNAARREVQEETGLTCENLWLCAVVNIDTGQDLGISMHVFLGESLEGEPRSSDEGTLEWINKDTIQELDLVEDIPHLLPRVLAMQSGDAPLWAHYSYDKNDELVIRWN